MHQYKMIALDLDGTLLRPDSSLSDYSIGVLQAVAETGVKVVICTGRLYEAAFFYLNRLSLNNPGIFCNGAQLRTALDGEILDECPLPLEEARIAIHLGEEAGGHPRIYMDDRIYVSRLIEEDRLYAECTRIKVDEVGDLPAFLKKDPLKLITLIPDPASIPPLMEKNATVFGNRLYFTQSSSTFVEYMNTGATKGKGVKKLADRWGFSKEAIVVAGDHFNDLPMFEEAALSLAPSNAQEKVRAAASIVCLSNAEDGVAKTLEEIFLR